MTPAHAPLPTDCSLPFQDAWPPASRPAGNQTSIRMSESGVGLSVAVTRQKAGRFVIARPGAPPDVSGGVNVPREMSSARVIVVCGSASDVRLSHGAAAARVAVIMTATIVNIDGRRPA